MNAIEQDKANLERVLAKAAEHVKADTAKMPVGEAIIVTSRFADMCAALRAFKPEHEKEQP